MDPRNRPVILGSIVAGLGLFLVVWLLLDWSPLLAWIVAWSPVAFAAYGIDKRAAVSGGWRIPEAVLHGLALVGGVIGAWAGRAVFRHKTQRPVFLAVLVLASIIWGLVAVLAITGRV